MLMMRWPTKLEWPREKMNVYVEEVQGVKLFFHELKNGSNLLEECRPCALVDFYKMFNREIL